jgi:hypothetical protein
MATKTFTQATLTADDLNTYSSKGDTYINSASVSAGSILNCFSATYENYKIVVSNFFATADSYLWFQLGASGSYSGGSYYQGGAYQAYSTGTITTYSNNNTLPYWQICAGCTAATGFSNSAVVNVSRPFAANNTCYTAQSTLHLSGGIYAWYHMGQHAVAGSYNGFRWSTTAGAVSSGTITVYGVTQA